MKRALFALMLLATPALAHDQMAGTLHIIHPSIPLPAGMAKSAAGYVTISNEGDTPVAAHITDFWEPRMRAQLRDYAAAGGAGLDEIVLKAVPLV